MLIGIKSKDSPGTLKRGFSGRYKPEFDIFSIRGEQHPKNFS